MKRRKIISIIIICAVIAASVIGIVAAVRKTTGMNAAVTVYPASSLNWGGGWYYSSSMEGYATSGTTQSVYAGETETVDKVLVKEGQSVKKGDLILTYDTEKTGIDLEKAKLEREHIQLEIETAKENLKTLSGLVPVTYDDGEDPDDIIPDEEESEEETVVLHTELTDGAVPFYMPPEIGGEPGSEDNPYRFLCADGTVIYPSFADMMLGMGTGEGAEGPVYFQLEIHKDNDYQGELLRAWKQSTADMERPADDWRAVLRLNDRPDANETIASLQSELENTKQQLDEANRAYEEAVNSSSKDSERISELEQRIAALEKELEEAKQALDDLSGDDGPGGDTPGGDTPGGDTPGEVTPVPGDPSSGTPGSGQGMSFITTENGSAITSGNGTVKAGNGSTIRLLRLETPVRRMLLAAGDEEDAYMPSMGSLIPKNAEYTAEEIKEAKKEEERNLRDLEIDLREADLNISLAEKAFAQGEVRAAFDGVVRKAVSADEKPAAGTPMIEIAGSAGMSIKGGIPEQDLGNIKEGDTVMVMSWESGLSYTGKISEISPYPDTGGSFSTGMSYSSSYYPFTAVLDDDKAELGDHEWVQISISGEADPAAASDKVNLYRPFVRTDDGTPYVYKRGEDGLLVKQYVELGKLDGDQYEIKAGVANEDWIAFPYGKQVKEGARTAEGSMEELYM